MSSFFKGSCFIFWLTWLLSLSFLLGTYNFINNHVMLDRMLEASVLIMRIVCIMNILFAFVGCVFLKCSINNIICAIMYIIPVGLIMPGLAIWGAINNGKIGRITPKEAFGLMKAELHKNKEIPRWLTLTEDENKCCGINGPLDYRLVYRSYKHSDVCTTILNDIPCTCCVARKSTHSMDSEQVINNCQTKRDLSQCYDKSNSSAWMAQVVQLQQNMNPTVQEKCDTSNTSGLILNSALNFNETLYARGCYARLDDFHASTKTSLTWMFAIIAFCDILMLIAYVRCFCDSERFTGKRSNHSLDVETISLLDLPSVLPTDTENQTAKRI